MTSPDVRLSRKIPSAYQVGLSPPHAIAAAAALTFTACGGSSGADTAPSTVTAPSTSATTPTTTTSGTTTSTSPTLAYSQDIKPILESDCIVCHGSRIHENNVRLDMYTNVMRVVTTKSDLIRSWVVINNAAESR